MKIINLVACLALVLGSTVFGLSTTATAETPYQVEWIQQTGTAGDDISRSVAVDNMGNAYISGHTLGSLEGANAGGYDAYLTKFDSSGTEVWTQQIGTTSSDFSNSVAVDSMGNVYISGQTSGSLEGSSAGGIDVYLTKFDSSGAEVWIQQVGSASNDYSNSVVVDSMGNAYISGYTLGSLEGSNAGGYDAYLTKFDSSGTEVWTQQIGTAGNDRSYSVAVDSTGNAYISGYTEGSLEGTNAGGVDAYLTKFDSSGTEVWSKQIGTASDDQSYSVAVDSQGNAYISGRTDGIFEGTNTGSPDAFLTKFDSSGTELWTEQIGTASLDISNSVVVDSLGNAYISGFTLGSLEGTNAGGYDAYLTKFDSSGTELWTQQTGTTGDDLSYSVAVDSLGNAYISGFTTDSLEGTNAGGFDAFLIKFSAVPEPSTLLLGAFTSLGLLLRRKR